MKVRIHFVGTIYVLLLVLFSSMASAGVGIPPAPEPLACNGTPGQWAGCRGNGCAVCSELVTLYPLYWYNHPLCTPNTTCASQYYTCNSACPAPTSADYCNGTPGQWAGCRGNGCAVCTELVEDYPLYFENHPLCSPNETCAGLHFTCNAHCPAPTSVDACGVISGDVNLNGLACDVADVVALNSYLACQSELTADQITASDVNGDCLVDQNDADYLLSCLSGGPDPIDCVCTQPQVTGCRCSLPGDTNGNTIVAEIGDVIYLGNFLCSGGPAPYPLANGDVDGDCDIDLTDYNVLLSIVVNGGQPAACSCGTPTVIGCQ